MQPSVRLQCYSLGTASQDLYYPFFLFFLQLFFLKFSLLPIFSLSREDIRNLIGLTGVIDIGDKVIVVTGDCLIATILNVTKMVGYFTGKFVLMNITFRALARSERLGRGGPCWLLKLIWMGTQRVQIRRVLPWLVHWACPVFAAPSRPVQKHFLHCTLFHLSPSPSELGRKPCWVAYLLVCVSGRYIVTKYIIYWWRTLQSCTHWWLN